MKKLFLAALLAASLIDNSRGVWITYCTVDNIRYSYRRADGAFINGEAR